MRHAQSVKKRERERRKKTFAIAGTAARRLLSDPSGGGGGAAQRSSTAAAESPELSANQRSEFIFLERRQREGGKEGRDSRVGATAAGRKRAREIMVWLLPRRHGCLVRLLVEHGERERERERHRYNDNLRISTTRKMLLKQICICGQPQFHTL